MKITDQDGKLVITDFNEEEAYQIACNIEKEGMKFYRKLKTKQADTKIREMLDFMINDEEKHLKFFEYARNELQEQTDVEAEDNDLIMSIDFGIFQPYESIENLEEIITDSKRALKLGAVVENKSIVFYTECKKQISSGFVKREIDKIVLEEIKHKTLFEEMIKKIS